MNTVLRLALVFGRKIGVLKVDAENNF